MPALKNIFLSVLLLTAASSRVKGNSTTVTLFDIAIGNTTPAFSLIDVSAVGVGADGGTTYVDKDEVTITSSGSPVVTTETLTAVEAASWRYASVQVTESLFTGGIQENCTVEANGTTAECVEILVAAGSGALTTPLTVTFSAQVVPFATITVTGPTPTSSSAAIIDNPIFNRLLSFFWGILFIFMFF